MKISTLHRKESGLFSQQQLDMVYNQENYKSFLANPFSKEAFGKQLEVKSQFFTAEMRQKLVETLEDQYKGVPTSELTAKNIESLKNEDTFTIVTGHQLVVFTGPLYFIYKIAHVIKMCQELKEQYPTQHFVPVFWMATEDHDYEEIKSFHLFNRTISWETDQNGPVGRFEMKDWEPVFEQLKDLYKNHPESELFALIDAFKGDNYAQAFRQLVNQMVAEFGVVIVDGDHSTFKQSFLPYMQQEVETQFSFKAITEATDLLVMDGGKAQIMPREINLFYIENGLRERLVPLADGTIEIAGKGVYSKAEIIKWMEECPVNFSPNVSLRPLFQEVILPNLCYVGGAGEISYWLQLKGVFDGANVPFPMIQTRNSVIWIDKNSADKMNKLHLSILDTFKELHVLHKEYLALNATDEVDFNDLDAQFLRLKEQLVTSTIAVDPALESYAIAESVRMEKQLTQIKDRLYKTVKGKHDGNLKSLTQVKEKLFPSNGLQERYTNFFQLNSNGNYSETLRLIVNNMQPFNGDLLIFQES